MRSLRWVAVIIAAVLWGGPVHAHDAKSHTAALLVDHETGEVLEAENANHLWYPASLTKAMTAYLVFEALADGRLALDQKVPVSEHAASQPPTKLGLGRGKNVRVKLLLEAMLVRSSNDAAVVLAEAVSGSEENFAQAMTRRARQLGMSQSFFANATGLPDESQVTTARDMVILARALITNFPDRFHFFTQETFRLNKRTRLTTNGWMRAYPGAEGIKTGFTCGSGYNLLGTATRNGRRLVGVVLGGRSSGWRNIRMTKMMDAGFAGDLPAGGAGLLLAALRGAVITSAPNVLPGNACAVARSPTPAVLTGGRLPGWGVIFGSFITKAKANDTIKRNKKVLNGVAPKGRPAIILKPRENGQRYTALLVGLQRADAGEACLKLRSEGHYCLTLAPKQLNNPNAIWR